MKGIYRFYVDCGYGQLEGIFIATDGEIKQIIGQIHDFGDILGKHSQVIIKFDKDMFEFVTDDQEAVEIFEKYCMETGYNPTRILRGDYD